MALCALSSAHHGCLPPASSAVLMIHMLMSVTLSDWLLQEQLLFRLYVLILWHFPHSVLLFCLSACLVDPLAHVGLRRDRSSRWESTWWQRVLFKIQNRYLCFRVNLASTPVSYLCLPLCYLCPSLFFCFFLSPSFSSAPGSLVCIRPFVTLSPRPCPNVTGFFFMRLDPLPSLSSWCRCHRTLPSRSPCVSIFNLSYYLAFVLCLTLSKVKQIKARRWIRKHCDRSARMKRSEILLRKLFIISLSAGKVVKIQNTT